MFSHDLLVHALAIAAFMPEATVDDLVAEARAMLEVYQAPEVQGAPALRDYVKSVLRARVIQFDRQTAQIMVIASQRGPQRFENLSALFAEMGGGRSRARARLLSPSPDTDAPLNPADRQVLERLLR
jgi:hypothetical protein